MKNKKLINEQQSTGLGKFFYPGCFEAGDANADPTKAAIVKINLKNTPTQAIKKQSTTTNKMIYYTEDGNAYVLESNAFKSIGEWSCKSAPNKAISNPALQYFNTLNIDLTKNDAKTLLKRVIQELNLAIRAGGMSDEFQNFREYYDILKKDPEFSDLPELLQTTNQDFANRFKNLFQRDFTPFASPYDVELPRFTEKTISVGNPPKVIKYYQWKAGSTQTKSASTYDAQTCYKFLTDYIDKVDRGEISNVDDLDVEKSTLFACYNPFWIDGKLSDENRTGTRKLGLSGREKKYLAKLLPQLMQSRSETGVSLGDGSQQAKTPVYESLEKRLKNALLESIEVKKKSLIEENIIKARFSALVNENLDYTKQKNYIPLINEAVVEMRELQENGYSEKLINENFFSWLSGLLGDVPGSVPQVGKEYIVDWFLKILGIEKTSFIANVISAAIGNVPTSDYGKLFTDCRFTSEVLSKSIVEGFLKQMTEKQIDSGVSGAVVSVLRNTITDSLFKDKEGMVGGMTEKINDLICGKLNAVHSKMEDAKREITDRALS